MPDPIAHPSPLSPSPIKRSWRQDAVRIVEELFLTTLPSHWDLLLDLRDQLLKGQDWNKTFDVFLSCRDRMESDHYLPFYRLRRLMTQSLRLEAGNIPAATLEDILRRKHRSLTDVGRAVHRELFEHSLDVHGTEPVSFRLVER